MTNNSQYQSALQRQSVLESDTNPLNSMVNLLVNPNQFVPTDWAESNPNISVSNSGFIDDSPLTGPDTPLQSQQEGAKMRIRRIIEHFEGLKADITEWEHLINYRVVSVNEINTQFNGFTR